MALTYRRKSATTASGPDVREEIRQPAAEDDPAPDSGANGAAADTAMPPPQSDGVDGGGEALLAALALSEEFGGGRLLLSDMRTAFLLIDQVRLRAIARLFGVGPDQANLLTLVAALTLAQAARGTVQRVIEAPLLPNLGDSLLVGTSARELLCSVAGPSVRATPQLGTLLAVAVVGSTAGPAVLRSLRAARAGSHRAALGFHHRYGYIVDPGHWREHRARRLKAPRAQNGRPGPVAG